TADAGVLLFSDGDLIVSWGDQHGSIDRADEVILARKGVTSKFNDVLMWAAETGQRRYPSIHSITSSAPPSTDVGMSMPSALAVLRLITSSYLVGSCTGRSAGFSPLRMRST